MYVYIQKLTIVSILICLNHYQKRRRQSSYIHFKMINNVLFNHRPIHRYKPHIKIYLRQPKNKKHMFSKK